MKAQIKRAAWIVTGWLFLVAGVIGVFLPIMQGALFIFIGLLFLSSEYVWAHKLLQNLRNRFPRISRLLDRAELKAREWFRHSAPKPAPATAKADD
jgi:uncharacterized membrane protein YbaN (DUF454 family)